MSARQRLLLALARSDGQPWASIAEATEHTAEVMYGKQADAVFGWICNEVCADDRSRLAVAHLLRRVARRHNRRAATGGACLALADLLCAAGPDQPRPLAPPNPTDPTDLRVPPFERVTYFDFDDEPTP